MRQVCTALPAGLARVQVPHTAAAASVAWAPLGLEGVGTALLSVSPGAAARGQETQRRTKRGWWYVRDPPRL